MQLYRTFLAALALASPLASMGLARPQLDTVWERTGPEAGLATERFLDMIVHPDGDVIVSTTTDMEGPQRESHITRYDTNGSMLWTLATPFPGAGNVYDGYYDLAWASNGGLFVSVLQGSARSIERRAPDGSLIWTAPFAGSVYPLPDGGCVVVPLSSVHVGSTRIRRLDPNGTVVWVRDVLGGVSRVSIDVLGNTFLFGWNLSAHYVDLPIAAGRISYGGDVAYTSCEWMSCLQNGPRWFGNELVWNNVATLAQDFKLDARGHAYMALAWGNQSNWRLCAFDRTGAYTWHVGPFTGGSIAYRRLAVDSAGSVRYAGAGQGELGVQRLAPDGTQMWETVLAPGPGELDYFQVVDVVIDDEGNAFVYGRRGDYGVSEPFVVVVDPDGVIAANADFIHPGARNGYFQGLDRLAVDGAGHAVHAYSTQLPPNGQFDVGATVRKLVGGGVQGTPICDPAQPNSTGSAAQLVAYGSDERARADLTLVASGLPVGSLTLMLTGTAQQLIVSPGGSQGDICVGGNIGRYLAPGQVQFATADGRTSLFLDLATTPSATGNYNVLAGDTRYFQAWYRDANPQATSNFTSAVQVLFR